MILIGFNSDLLTKIQQKYPDNILIVNKDDFLQDNKKMNYPVNLLEYIKTNMNLYDVIYILYSEDIIAFLRAIKIEFNFIYFDTDTVSTAIMHSDENKFILNDKFSLNEFFSQFSWYSFESINDKPTENLTIKDAHHMKTLKDLIDDDSDLTDLDVIDLKKLQNKLKMGVLLQAKSMLSRVLKLTDILDKLYDELLNRIEDNITTTDTASLMYTTEYISKALNDTNQFIVSLVNNEKIQNFFIIDNSTVINTGNDTYDIDKRERIRKAAEIILNNYDNLVENNLDKVIDPNSVIEADKETQE